MKSISILGYELIDNYLRLDVEPTEINNHKVEVYLTNRATKKHRTLTPLLEAKNGRTVLEINVAKIPFNQLHKNIIDVHLVIDGKRKRVYFKNFNSENATSNFSSSMYKISNTRVAVPYITQKGNLSIMYGNAPAVFASYCEAVKEKLTISNVKITKSKVKFKIADMIIADDTPYFIALYNRDEKKFIPVNYTFQANKPSEFEIDLSNMKNYELSSEYNLFLMAKTKDAKIDYRLTLDQKNKFKPFKVRRDKKVAPYVNDKGVFTFMVTDDHLLDKQNLHVKRNTLFIKNYQQDSSVLNVDLKAGKMVKDFESYAILIKNVKTAQMVTLHHKEATFNNENQLRFHLERMFSEGIFSNGQRWKIYLKLYKNKTVFVYEIKKEDEVIEAPINRHMKPVKVKAKKSVITYLTGLNELAFLIGGEAVYNREVYKKESGQSTIENVQVTGQLLSFKMNAFNRNISSGRLMFRERKSKDIWWQDVVVDNSTGLVTVDLSTFIDSYQNEVSRWDLFLELNNQGRIEFNKIGCFDKQELPSHKRYFSSIKADSTNVVTPYLTIKNELAIIIRPEQALYNEKLKSKMSIEKFGMKKGIISGDVILELPECDNYQVNQFIFKYRDKIEDIEYTFPAEQTKINKNTSKVSYRIDLKDLELQNYYWDLFVVITVDGENYLQKLKNPAPKVRKTITNRVIRYSYEYDNGFFVYPYITSVNTLAFGYKKKEVHEGLSYKIKENLAYYTYKLFKPYFERKSIWLGFEKFSEGAQDNGYFFFKYCYDNNKKKNFYYIMKKDSPDYSNLEGMEDKVIDYMSFKHMLYVYAAELLVSSESKGHAYDIRIEKGRLRRALETKKHVFLQHGVIALKKVDHVFRKTGKNFVDLFVVSSDYEKNIIKDSFGYNDKEVIVTGLSRWDVLEDKSQQNKEKVIFVMPTWRTWMDDLPEEKFINTDYYKNYTGLLTSPKLNALLEEKNIKLQFYIHPKFKDYVDKFKTDNKNVKIYQYGEEKVNELLMHSSMLVTDYSSVAWEMFHMRKPILFYQFDIDEYNMYQGSYLDMDKDLFGDRAFDLEHLINGIQEYANRDFEEKEEYGKYRKHYFKYVDKNNCKRTFTAIMKNSKKLALRQERSFAERLRNNRYTNKLKAILRKNRAVYNFVLKTQKLIVK
ncbi:CDP-glycerol glycerophosphotransferase family protein [Niallia sp.]|uniref:CDP-glycerol glycerophosphotransferase family protein n=1 Tax=Niallia sp. TaxID=2837523 RepID=UPI00289D7459|nr:CDP-glycerol glycerophosphotransferase family protein [Niallia sp.]